MTNEEKIIKIKNYKEVLSYVKSQVSDKKLVIGISALCTICSFLSISSDNDTNQLAGLGLGFLTAGICSYQTKFVIDSIADMSILQNKIKVLEDDLKPKEEERMKVLHK